MRDLLEGETLTVVALGPLTDIAVALHRKPHLLEHISHIVMMGGSESGALEFNFALDPLAADFVLGLDVRKSVLTVEACAETVFTSGNVEELRAMLVDGTFSGKKWLSQYMDRFVLRRLLSVCLCVCLCV